MESESDSYSSPKYMILFFVVLIFFSFAGYMYFANKKMIESGVHSKLNKKSSKKKLKQNWSIDG